MLSYLKKGMNDEAMEALLHGMQAAGATPEELTEARRAYERSGLKAIGRYLVDKGMQLQSPVMTRESVYNNLLAGDKKHALTLLEEAYNIKHSICVSLKVDPTMDALRSEPRFIALVEKMGFDD
jgi:hypothetical protein